MTQGKIQLAPQSPVDKRVITISRPQRLDQHVEAEDPLFVNVIRRRWMLLAVCLLLSGVAAALVAAKFRLPKAETTGQLRYISLPPTLHDVYTAPQTLELVEILKSNEIMTALAERTGLQMDPKDLRERFKINTMRYSNIIDVELRWDEGKQAIELVNMLMQIACETTAANRKQTLSQYAVETQMAYEAANQRVAAIRDRVMQLRQDRDTRLTTDGTVGTEAERLMGRLSSTEDALDTITLRRMSLKRSLATLQSDVDTLSTQIRQELLSSRRAQLKTRQEIYNPNTQKYVELQQVAQELDKFEASGSELDYVTWRTKLESIGAEHLGQMDPASLAAITVLERQLSFKESKIEQVEFELLPIDGELAMYENRRESLERRLADAMGTADLNSTVLEEAEAQLDEAIVGRGRLLDNLNSIRRGEETDFSEMTILTEASWQTTETSDGRLKLFVFTFAGCFVVLVMPVFALEHFCPSGDPADHAAKSLGIPRVSRGTFLTQRVGQERRQLHPVNSEAMRLLALRIQQSVHGPGAMVLFSGLNHEKSSIPMISYLAECLARREERVLIIDACDRPQDSRNRFFNDDTVNAVLSSAGNGAVVREEVAEASTTKAGTNGSTAKAAAGHTTSGRSAQATKEPKINGKHDAAALPANIEPNRQPGVVGLSDFLHRRDLGPDDMICHTSIPGVDIIPCGSTSFPREGLASSSLTGLFEECRQRYTMILVAGPSTNQPSDLQMLSARADGILFTVPSTGRPAGKGEDVVRDLLDLGAPVIGIVS